MTRAHLRASVSTTCATRNTVWATEFTVWATVFTVAQTVNPPLGAKKGLREGDLHIGLCKDTTENAEMQMALFPDFPKITWVSVAEFPLWVSEGYAVGGAPPQLQGALFALSSRLVPSMDITKQTSTPCEGCKMAVCHDGPFLRGCANKKARRPYAGAPNFYV